MGKHFKSNHSVEDSESPIAQEVLQKASCMLLSADLILIPSRYHSASRKGCN